MPQIYFSFPDGLFDYVCAECDALCCRGQGFGGNLRREMGTLLTLYPSLHSMAVRRRGDVVHFATFRQGCQFLAADRSCRIEREQGKALKPGVCTLFPFNAFSRIGDVLIVSPHFLCPLRMRIPPMPGAVAGTHAVIGPAVIDSQLIEDGFWTQAVSSVPVLEPDHSAVFGREQAFRDLCGSAVGHSSFRSVLRQFSADPAGLSERAARAAGYLMAGVTPPEAPDAIDDVLLAIAPTFRFGLLGLTGESILLALAIAEQLLRESNHLASTMPTPQTAHTYLSSMTPLLKLVAHTSETRVVDAHKVRMPPFGTPQMTRQAERLLAGLWSGQSGLAAVEDAVTALPERADRMAMLLEVGRTCV